MEKKEGIKKKTISAIFVVIFLMTNLFIFGPSNIFLNNRTEFPLLYHDLLIYLVIITVILVLLTVSILILLPLKLSFYKKIISLIFMTSLLLWIQGNIIVWQYGLLNGQTIDWDAKVINGIIDSSIWIVFLAGSLIFSGIIYKKIKTLCTLFIIIQCSVFASFIHQAEVPSFKLYNISNENRFNFSKNQNIIVLVLDAFQTDIFQEIINEDKYYKDIFDGFTYFRNSLGGYTATDLSIPLILTGKYYKNSTDFENWKKNTYLRYSVPKILKSNDYRVDIFPYYGAEKSLYFDDKIASNFVTYADSMKFIKNLTKIIDISLFRIMPHFIKKYIHNDYSWFLTSLINYTPANSENAILELEYVKDMNKTFRVTEKKHTFKFYHILAPHLPLRLNEKLEYEKMANNRNNFKRQAKAALELTKRLFDRLKSSNIFDQTMIFVVGDHGAGHNNQKFILPKGWHKDENSTIITQKWRISALPLVIAKPFKSKGDINISDFPVSLSDIANTIFSELNLTNNDNTSDFSIFNPKENTKRKRRFYIYNRIEKNGYYGPMQEYYVDGFSWINESWYHSGNTFAKEKLPDKDYKKKYKYGEIIQFGKKGNSKNFKGNGWSVPGNGATFNEGKKANLYLQLETPISNLILTISVYPFIYKGILDLQRVGIFVNSNYIEEFAITNSGEYKININKKHILNGMNELAFEFKDAAIPGDIVPNNQDARLIAISFRTIKLQDGS